MGSLDHFKNIFNSVGWFLPAYIPLGILDDIASRIDKSDDFKQTDLEDCLADIYTAENLAAMVSHRYPITPFISEYSEIISESVEAHFSCLGHVAVSGLMPVIEGAGRKLAKHRSIKAEYIKDVFRRLAEDCIKNSRDHNIGDSGEIESMMNSMIEFSKENLYINSTHYPHEDNTNRHGILHGAFSDKDYGEPINFFKAIASIDFLCFISAFDANISWFAPSHTSESDTLARYYRICLEIHSRKP